MSSLQRAGSPSPYVYYPEKWWDDSDPDHVRQMHQGLPLPVEVLRQVFLCLDPHTLYASIRALNRHWKEAVETDLIPQQFRSRRWRLGLRVSRHHLPSPPSAASNNAALAGPETQAQRRHADPGDVHDPAQADGHASTDAQDNLAEQHASRAQQLLATPDAREDELARLADEHARMTHASNPDSGTPSLSSAPLSNSAPAAPAPPLIHVIPLAFVQYNPANLTLHFSTGREWHALFTSLHQGNGSHPHSSWLGLDFGLCWRFWGDAKPDPPTTGWPHIDQLNRDWGLPNEENGWLSRFWFVSRLSSCLLFGFQPSGVQCLTSGPEKGILKDVVNSMLTFWMYFCLALMIMLPFAWLVGVRCARSKVPFRSDTRREGNHFAQHAAGATYPTPRYRNSRPRDTPA